ncbi:MAG: DUF222 domain-containing protein, partial [Microbacterium sp.]|uniref:HNH endonuclease signature motif containing protein n=1 Tax=Microbacterium sp. TaxID=51671 RepID=UPI0039E3FCE6
LRRAAAIAGAQATAAADEELAAAARADDGAPRPTAEELRIMATVWATHLDPDGAEPTEARAMRMRGLTFGRPCRGLVPVSGHLLVEVAGQFQSVSDSLLNPHVDGLPVPTGPRFADENSDDTAPPADHRTRAQKQHDVLATILTQVAASGILPTNGGSAPTLVVSVRAEDLAEGRGYAHVNGIDEPVSLGVARHTACAGNIQRVVFDGAGRIVELGSLERIFTHHQRRAIKLRDGGCVIPGCTVPADWCEIHHVIAHANGGPTHTDNGVALCWFHHRWIDHGEWQVRMNRGVPEIRGPSWWDRSRRWRRATSSPVRMAKRRAGRMNPSFSTEMNLFLDENMPAKAADPLRALFGIHRTREFPPADTARQVGRTTGLIAPTIPSGPAVSG